MKTSRSRVMSALLSAGVICLLAILATYSTSAQQTKGKGKADAKVTANPRISYPGYISGTVTSEKGPEAGVWVIAETNDLQTKMIKTVVTDDQGRYMLPDLPAVNYKVFARGYGILDSTPIDSKPTTNSVAIKVATAKTPQEAAKVYPGDYWLSLLAPPPKNMFPGTGEKSETNPNGNGLNVAMASQDEWINRLKSGCNFCHQLGNPLSRDVQHVFAAKPDLPKTHADAW
ncbi:MAG TPA: carboxypeptidase-like regulatory domain-containing protein [Bryobacteraceae bacterium]|nr:carboxypeptidase-like regulatory domain-containing protein [Bryobacteraceae bacterium]